MVTIEWLIFTIILIITAHIAGTIVVCILMDKHAEKMERMYGHDDRD